MPTSMAIVRRDGAVNLADGLALFDCTVHAVHEAGDERAGGKAKDHRNQHDLHDAQGHRSGVDRHVLTGKPERQERSEDRRQQGRDTRHGHGQRHVAFGQVGHDVGSRAAGCAADQDDAGREGRRQRRRGRAGA